MASSSSVAFGRCSEVMSSGRSAAISRLAARMYFARPSSSEYTFKFTSERSPSRDCSISPTTSATSSRLGERLCTCSSVNRAFSSGGMPASLDFAILVIAVTGA